MIIYIVICLQKMCITNDKTACQVQNYMLFLFLSENFQSLKSHHMISVKDLSQTLYWEGQGEKQHNNSLLKPHQFLVNSPFSSF